jgi:hypothetical protein
MKILSVILLFSLVITLNGCIGVQTIYSKYIGAILIDSGRIYTKPEVIDLVGKPKREWSGNGYEHIAYSNRGKGWKWHGVVLYAIIPIPLVIPLGSEESVLIFKNNILERAIGDSSKNSFFGCILFNIIHQNKDGSYDDKSINDICANLF